MVKKLDLKDMKILYELDKDCRQSNSAIAKKIGLSKQVVNYRIAKLERSEIITGYFTQLNAPKLGNLYYKVMLKLQNITLEKEQDIVQILKESPDVHWIVSCFGKWDIVFVVASKSATQFNDKLMELLGEHEQYINQKYFLLMLNTYHFNRSYLLPKKKKTSIVFDYEPSEPDIDSTDTKMLEVLSGNPRMTIMKIARNAGVSVDIARYRMKKLVKEGIIQAFRAGINREALGYQYWNIMLKTKDLTKRDELKIIEFLKTIPQSIFATKYLGGYNFGFEVDVKSIDELNSILQTFRQTFGKIIKSFETVLYIKEHRIPYYSMTKPA